MSEIITEQRVIFSLVIVSIWFLVYNAWNDKFEELRNHMFDSKNSTLVLSCMEHLFTICKVWQVSPRE